MEAAKQAAKLTAVVVLPTPPFWFAQAMILAKCFPTRNLTNVMPSCKLFHVERKYCAYRANDSPASRSDLSPFELIVGIRLLDSPSCGTSISRETHETHPIGRRNPQLLVSRETERQHGGRFRGVFHVKHMKHLQ